MSKSKGNVVTPMDLFESTAPTPCATGRPSARPGVDTAFDEGQMKVGRKLANKLLNASKFVLGIRRSVAAPTRRRRASPNRSTGRCSRSSTPSSTKRPTRSTTFDYARALERTEAFFWWFCDDYVELVKGRAYGADGEAGAASAQAALARALDTMLRLLAPFLPFATEEVWSWWRESSVHRASWPDAEPLRTAAAETPPSLLTVAGEALTELRRTKSEAKRKLRTPIVNATITDTPERLAELREVLGDVSAAGVAAEIDLVEGDTFSIEADLEPE
jgi:valyl-tRNA synthetase